MLYKHFHDHVKKSRGEAGAFSDPKDWSDEWKTVYFKEYPRFPKIKLTLPKKKPGLNLFEALKERKSEREFNGGPIDIRTLGQLLIYSAGIQQSTNNEFVHELTNKTNRTYPSGGGRYPIELYLINLKSQISNLKYVKNLESGIYHF